LLSASSGNANIDWDAGKPLKGMALVANMEAVNKSKKQAISNNVGQHSYELDAYQKTAGADLRRPTTKRTQVL
jgi:hypothetical protein